MFYRNNAALVALFIFTVISFQNLSHAQLNSVTAGSATDLGGNCFEITPDQNFLSGGVWYDNPIDFANDFTIYYQNNFGTKDTNGADGMALVFKTDATAEIGIVGGGIGYEGILNSLIIEFDTYKNSNRGDPNEDHTGIMSNGVSIHSANSSLAGPIQASSTSVNIEDGIDHNIKIVWVANTKTLEVYFDCDLRLSVTKDVKIDIFGGDDSVFFGFVGSTGGKSNLHQVCFNSVSFVENLNLNDTTICYGETVSLDATIPSGIAYSWNPTTGVNDPNSANPTVAPNETTTYTVSITDVCGDITTENVLISVNPITTPTFSPINPICKGDILLEIPSVSNNGISGSWAPELNNMETTEYTFTPTPITGVCFEESKMTITVLSKINPVFTQVEPICYGNTIMPLPTTSNCGITGAWTPSLNNLETTLYTFTPDPGQCAESTTMTLIINTINPLTISVTNLSEQFEANQIISVTATGGSGIYEYQLDGGIWQSESRFQFEDGCNEHILAIRDVVDMCSSQPETTISLMTYPKFFTPNGDGFNDTWNIKCLSDDPSAMIYLYDRYGKLLFQFKPSENAWNGTFNGRLLAGNDYWFVADYLNSNMQETQYKSHFSLRH
jgi:gliding motility-associated-like protein